MMQRLILPVVAAVVVAAGAGAQEPPRTEPPKPVPAPAPAPTPTPAPPLEAAERLRLEAERIRSMAIPDIDAHALQMQALEAARLHELAPLADEMRWQLQHELAPALQSMEWQMHFDEREWEQQAREWEQQAREWERQWEAQAREWERDWESQAREWERQSAEWERDAREWERHAIDMEREAFEWSRSLEAEALTRTFDEARLGLEEMHRGVVHEALAPWQPAMAFQLPESRFPEDPADSLYRAAREMLNRGEYRRAAQTFRSIGQRFPTSKYAPDALYYEAFALYRIGTVAEMRNALALLEQQREKYPRSETDREAASLAMRIRGELAANGDVRAASEIRGQVAAQAPRASGAPSPTVAVAPPRASSQTARTAQGQSSCDRDSMAVKLEALSALSKIESPEVTPALRRVLQRRDECSASLRRRAVLLLGQQQGAEIGDVLIDVAKNDPDTDVRREAIGLLAKVSTDQSVNALQELVQTGDSRLTSYAMRALHANPHPRSSQAVRTVLERNDIAESVRLSALSSFSRATPEEAAYLRGVYTKLESRRLRSQAISTIARLGGPENEQWLLALARNEGESMELREEAIARLANTAPIAEVAKLYDQAADRRLKERLISSLNSRKEPEAVDKLIAIARSDADHELRRQAISYLSRKKDPRTTQLLLEIIGR